MLSNARTTNAGGEPTKPVTGTKRIIVPVPIARAVAPSATVPTANQLVPELLEYCHVPCVLTLAVLPTIAIPPKLDPVSTSAKSPVKIVVTVAPGGLLVLGRILANAPVESVGASFTLVTVIFEVAVAILNAVVPPLTDVLTLVP